jgi:hypothetical protein
MRSFQDDHELRELEAKAREVGAASPPPAPSGGSARNTPAKGSQPGSPAGSPTKGGGAKAPAASGAAPETAATLRTNVTIAVIAMCAVLIVMILVNSGTSKTLLRPRSLVFVVDGVTGAEVARAAALKRAPFLAMLAEIGASTIGSTASAPTATTTSRASNEYDASVNFIHEIFSGDKTGATPSILRGATSSGYTVALVGDYPLIPRATDDCGAVATECATKCTVDGKSCNYRETYAASTAEQVKNATKTALNGGAQVVVARLKVTPEFADNQYSRDSALFMADAAIGRATMSAVSITATTNENILLFVVAANPLVADDGLLTVVAFQGTNIVKVNSYADTPRVGDVAATMAKWLDVQYAAPASAPLAICAKGSEPANC